MHDLSPSCDTHVQWRPAGLEIKNGAEPGDLRDGSPPAGSRGGTPVVGLKITIKNIVSG